MKMKKAHQVPPLTLSHLRLHFQEPFDLRLHPLLGSDIDIAIVRAKECKGLLANFHLLVL